MSTPSRFPLPPIRLTVPFLIATAVGVFALFKLAKPEATPTPAPSATAAAVTAAQTTEVPMDSASVAAASRSAKPVRATLKVENPEARVGTAANVTATIEFESKDDSAALTDGVSVQFGSGPKDQPVNSPAWRWTMADPQTRKHGVAVYRLGLTLPEGEHAIAARVISGGGKFYASRMEGTPAVTTLPTSEQLDVIRVSR